MHNCIICLFFILLPSTYFGVVAILHNILYIHIFCICNLTTSALLTSKQMRFYCNLYITICFKEGTPVAQWLRYCATNQKVAGSIPDGVMEFFIDINPSDRTMALCFIEILV
jgi:hypothetical protein